MALFFKNYADQINDYAEKLASKANNAKKMINLILSHLSF